MEFFVMLGLLVGAVVLYFIYNNFIKKALFKGKGIAGKAEALMKKDLSSQCARCTFYLFHNYDKGFSQSEWKALYETFQKRTQEMDKDSEEYAKLAAPFINAIVVDGGFYVRRGMQDMNHSGEHFVRGVNDRISLNYYVEPYEYVKDEEAATKYAHKQAQAATTAVPHNWSASEVRAAEKRYRDAVYKHKKFMGSNMETYYEIEEQKAYAALLGAQAKAANRK